MKTLTNEDIFIHNTQLIIIDGDIDTQRKMLTRFERTFWRDANGNNPQEVENNVDEQIERLLGD